MSKGTSYFQSQSKETSQKTPAHANISEETYQSDQDITQQVKTLKLRKAPTQPVEEKKVF